MTGRQIRKRGFTLVETVVTVGIIAALAAVVYPQVVKQFDSADPARVAEDLNSIRTALDAFGVNVRPNQPGDIEDLANVIGDFGGTGTAAQVDSTIRGAAFVATDSLAWLGPYLTSAIAVDAADGANVITTGFGALIRNHFAPFDVDAAASGGGAEVATTSTVADFVAVVITGLSGAAFNAVNELIDGTGEDDATKRRQQGRFRCPDTTPTDTEACTTAFYLAVPIR